MNRQSYPNVSCGYGVQQQAVWEGGVADEGLQFDPAVVPRLRTVYADALARVDQQIKLADGQLRVTPWAGDPISQYAGQQVNARSVDEAASALEALRSYRDALDTIVDKLIKAGGDYHESEQDKHASMSHQGEG
jgi:hypothetical protein